MLQVVGAILAGAAVQASLYDVPGGYKAVMFDRFSGVQNKVRYTLLLQCYKYLMHVTRQRERVPTSSFLGCNAQFCTTAGPNQGCVRKVSYDAMY